MFTTSKPKIKNRQTLPISPNLAASHDPETSVERLAILAKSGDPEVRAGVATHPSATPEMLVRLAHDPHWVVLAALAARPSAPIGALEHIAGRVGEIPVDAPSSQQRMMESVQIALKNNPTVQAAVQAAEYAADQAAAEAEGTQFMEWAEAIGDQDYAQY